LSLKFNRVGFGAKNIQIGNQFPKNGGVRLVALIGWVDSQDLMAGFGNTGFCSSINNLQNPTKNSFILFKMSQKVVVHN
jgi:hypothetical protein